MTFSILLDKKGAVPKPFQKRESAAQLPDHELT